MTRIDTAGTWTSASTADAPAITDIETIVLGSQLFVITTSSAMGSLTSWEWAGDQLVSVDREILIGDASLPAPGGLQIAEIGGDTTLLSYGGAAQGVSEYAFDGLGNMAFLDELGVGALTLESALFMETAQGSYLFADVRGEDGLSVWRVDLSGQLTQLPDQIIGFSGDGPDVSDMAQWSDDTRDYLIALDPMLSALSLYEVTSDGLSLSDHVTPQDGLPVQTPTEVEIVTLAGEDYALVGASGSSSISVLWLTAGQMIPVDHVIDDRSSRFEGLTVMETIEYEGRVFVLASGTDEGLTLLTLLPGGQLMALDTLADSTGAPLSDITAIEIVEHDGDLMAFVAGEGWEGVTALDLHSGTMGTVQTGGGGNERLDGSAYEDLIDGGAGDDTISGGAGDDILIDGAGRDVMSGGDGDDIFVLRADGATDRIEDFELGVDRINLSMLGRAYTLDALEFTPLPGGLRIDFGDETLDVYFADPDQVDIDALTLDMLFDLGHFPVAPLPSLPLMVTGTDDGDLLQGGDSDDTLIGGDGADEIMGLDGDDFINASFENTAFDEVSGQVVRLFQATLGRTPNQEGHLNWTQNIASGEITGLEAAAGFMASPEFQSIYGPTTDAEFVTLLYQNVLGRDPAASGLDAWVTNLENGMSREQVVWHFSESPEFQIAMTDVSLGYAAASTQGEWTDDVYRLFLATLGREPNESGLLAWSEALIDGTSYLEAITGFMESREFQLIYGPTTDEEFVTLLYENVLGRPPAQSGLDAWVTNLANGMTREAVVANFAQGPEFVANTTDDFVSFMQTQGVEDVLIGGEGNDTLIGGAMPDRFVFDAQNGGRDEIIGIETWDQVQLQGSPFGSGEEVLSALQQEGDDLVLDTGTAQLVFVNTDLSELTPEMFVLG